MNAREEWLQQRRAGLGGSDIGAILGLSPYRTPVDVWAEKTGRAAATEETLQMRFGTYAEEFVAREYCAKTNHAVQRFTTMLHHPVAPILGNVDRLVVPAGAKVAAHRREIRTDRGLECKTTSAFSAYHADEWGEEGTDLVPPAYLVQCVTYMLLTGCPHWDLAVLFGNQEVRVYHLHRDAELEEEVVARSAEWWQRHIISDEPPAPTCDADVKRLFPKSTAGKTVEASDELLAQFGALCEAKLLAKSYGEKADAAALPIKAAIGDAEALVRNGEPLVTWKSGKPPQRFDLDSFKAEHPELYQQYLKAGDPVRRFLIKE